MLDEKSLHHFMIFNKTSNLSSNFLSKFLKAQVTVCMLKYMMPEEDKVMLWNLIKPSYCHLNNIFEIATECKNKQIRKQKLI